MSWKTVSMKKQWLAKKSLALIFALALIFIFPMSSFAVTKWKGIVPGGTKKEEVSGILGEPKEINSSTYEYSSSEENIEKIVIEYKTVESTLIVDRIDVHFSEPIPKSDFVEAMKLPENADSQGEDPEGKLQEYYGSTKSLILTYKDETTKSGVKIVSYLSRERFESMPKGIAKTTVGFVGMEDNTDFPGSDISRIELSEERPELCRDACAQNSNCRAFTYVRPGAYPGNPDYAVCYLT